MNGEPDPGIALYRGRTYEFAVNAPGHPFFMKTVAGAGTANQFTDGVAGNGVTSGTLTFAVPASAPSLLYYQCSAHGPMVGTIRILDMAPVPAISQGWLGLLALCLLAGGALGSAALQARIRTRSA